MATSSAWKPLRSRSLLGTVALSFIACWLAAAPIAMAGPPPVRIYPSGELVPANHLKFYLHFQEPMAQGVFLKFCRLLDESGRPISEPFRETELWSEDRRRLTLWSHPGRQKTGVNLNEEFGPILAPGHRYILVIDGAWPTAHGEPLGAETRKPLRAGQRATAQLDTSTWELKPPRPGTTEPLEIRFPAPLDHALLQRCLRVSDSQGQLFPGKVASVENERTWRFTPTAPWASGPHRILVESILEDLAGNSLARPFEVDLQAPPVREVPAQVAVPFQIGPLQRE